ncbi:MAG: nitrite reductase large subunit NirB [Thermodesulfobacteriota bacterium]
MGKNAKKNLVVIGNGMAGVATVEEILKLDSDRYNITIFGKEPHPNYNRVLLNDLLTEDKTLADITLNDFSWYKERGIKLHTGSKVSQIDRARREVVAEDESRVPYDALILATGSLPFMPPIEGMDKDGVLTFRDIEDCKRIKEYAGKSKKAVVVGGGLLGLEAARGMLKLGLDVTVVHLMDRLMERQLDKRSAAYLKEDIEELGLKVLLNKETTSINGNGRVTGMTFKDGDSIETDIVLMAAGIKPNISLASEAGIYCNRGVVVSDTMQTYDPAIYAVGECTENRGQTFGLVAQVFDQARVLANHLASDCRLVFNNRPVSTRLKVPGIELYSAGLVTGGEGVETIEYHDRGMRLYKRLFLKDNRIEGVVMYGDVVDGPELFGYLIEGRDISDRRRDILFGSAADGGGVSVDSMSDETIVCGCNGITKGAIVDAVKTKGLFTLEDVKNETKASTSCGGCSTVIERILSATLGSSFKSDQLTKSICGCTKYSRTDVIKNIKEKRLKSVGEVMETLGWETVGCDECRPALNYYVSMVWPLEAIDDPTSRLVNERVHANIQKDETFSVVPRMYGGVTTPKDLKTIAEVAERYDVPLVKLTGGERIDLIGVTKDDLPKVWKDLGMKSGYAYAKALRTAKTCVGSSYCRYGTQDSLGLGIDLEKRFEGLWMPAKVKLGVSGCPRNCAESAVKDVGIVGVKGGFEIYVAGCGGINLKAAELLTTVEEAEEATVIVAAFLQHYREEAEYGERTYKWVERTGLAKIKEIIVDNTRERERLAAAIEEASSILKDPWEKRVTAASN